MTQMRRQGVVTAFLADAGKILLVKRSSQVGSYQGYWSAISGYLEDPTPLAQALREVREEAGLDADDLRLMKTGSPFEATDENLGVIWVIHPFLFAVSDPSKVRLDWENTELRWVAPQEIEGMQTVPKLKEALDACFDGAPPLA